MNAKELNHGDFAIVSSYRWKDTPVICLKDAHWNEGEYTEHRGRYKLYRLDNSPSSPEKWGEGWVYAVDDVEVNHVFQKGETITLEI